MITISRTRRLVALMLMMGWLAACGRETASVQTTPYVPFNRVPPAAASTLGSIKADFDAAMNGATQSEAISRWRRFLERHLSTSGEYEDSFHANHVRAAQYELMRLLYVTGDVAGGDEILRSVMKSGGVP